MENCKGDVLGYGLYNPGFDSGHGEKIFLFPKTFSLVLGPNQPHNLMGTGGFFPVLKRPGHEVDNSPPSSFEFKNEWQFTYIPLICIHGVDRDNIFYFAYKVNGLGF
jgi:hypothetical protein